MTMPDPRFAAQQTTQFPPPNFQGGVPAQVLDPNAPGYNPQDPNLRDYQNLPEHRASSAGGFDEETVTEEYGDYFGFDIRDKYIFPDGKQWIEFKVLSEGDLAKYQKLLKRDVVVEKQTGDARIKIDQVEERHALLMVAVTSWFVVKKDHRTGKYLQQTFSNGRPGSEVDKWIQNANPAIIADLAEQIRRVNPFLLGSGADTIEAIDKQIEQLTKQRQELVERQRGEASSASS